MSTVFKTLMNSYEILAIWFRAFLYMVATTKLNKSIYTLLLKQQYDK